MVILTASSPSNVLFGGAAKTTTALLRGSTSRNNNGNVDDADGEVLMNHDVVSPGEDLRSLLPNRDDGSNGVLVQPRHLQQQQQQYRRHIAKNGGGTPATHANIFAARNNGNSNTSSSSSRLHKESRIIGGSETGTTEFPFVVSLQDQYGHFCGGSLIAPNIVLTAA